MSLALNGTVNMLHLHNLCTLTSKNVVQGKDIDHGVEIFFWINDKRKRYGLKGIPMKDL